MNAVKWSGHRCTLKKNFRQLTETCQYEPGYDGIGFRDFDRCLRKEAVGRFEVRRRFRSSIREIETHLRREDGAVVINYCWVDGETGRRYGHFALFIDVSETGRVFTGINDKRGRAVVLRRRPMFLKHLRIRVLREDSYTREYPWVWFLTRVEK